MQDVIEAHKERQVKPLCCSLAGEFEEIDGLPVGAMRAGMQVAIFTDHKVVFTPSGKTIVLRDMRGLAHGAIVQLAQASHCR